MDRIIAGTPVKAPKDKSTWTPGDTFIYKNHPYPAEYNLNKRGKLAMLCSQCRLDITNDNPCRCSPQRYLIHKDRMKIGYVLRGISSGSKFTEPFIRAFELEKGCTPYEVGKYLNLAEIRLEKGITDCDHCMSPIGFDMTNPQHYAFICYHKNYRLLSSKKNKQKSSHNDPDEMKIAYEEFAKQTPPGDIHDILIARRKRGGKKEVHHIVEEITPDMNRSEEPSVWNEDEHDEEEAEYEAKIAKANAKREAKIAKANEKIARANAKYEAEIAKAKAECEDKIQKDISKYQSLIDALRKKQQNI